MCQRFDPAPGHHEIPTDSFAIAASSSAIAASSSAVATYTVAVVAGLFAVAESLVWPPVWALLELFLSLAELNASSRK